jgi:cytochrome P450
MATVGIDSTVRTPSPSASSASPTSNKGAIPGPSAPAAVQTLRWMRRTIPTLRSYHRAYGEVIQMRLLGLGPLVLVTHPDDVKMVFALSPDVGLAGQANAVLAPFLGQTSVLVSDGATHGRLRKLMMPSFQGDRMLAFGAAMREAAERLVDELPLFTPFSFQSRMQDVTLEIIVRTVFGVTAAHELAELTKAVRATLALTTWPGLLLPAMQTDLGPLSPWGRFRRHADEVDAILHRKIKLLREKPDGSIASSLVHARGEAGERLTDQEIAEQLITLLVAGHETTATALAWGLDGLLENPDIQRELVDELRTVPDLAVDKIARLPLLDATVKESLRRLPVIPLVGRRLSEPLEVRGYTVPAGTVIAPCIYLAHHRPEAFPDPDRFDPRRFLRDKPTSFELFPFGGGIRRCIGAAFATLEMKILFAVLLTRLSLRRGTSAETRPIRRSITLAPSGGLSVVCIERRRRVGSSAADAFVR